MPKNPSKKMQIVFASAECAPFVKTGGLGDVAGSLPNALNEAGAECIVMVPKYGSIKEEYTSKMEHLTDFYVSLGWRNEYCGLEKLVYHGVTYLFIDNERYFKRDYPYGFFDDGERFAFFSKAVTESLQHLPEGFECDVLHCNDWQTALAPVFLREFYQGLPQYDRVKTVFSIHNVAFQGQFTDKLLDDVLGLGHIPAASSQLRCDADSINYMLGALHYTDAITTVSPTYASEIQTPEYGEGLDGILRDRNYVLQGILNGIDTKSFDPATDPRIAVTFSVDNMAGKAECKRKLQEELGLEVRDDRPLMVMVTRLTRQKGLDLVMYSLDRILSNGIQVAVLGTGDRDYEDGLRYFASKYPGTMSASIQFDPALSQRMYAGADLFLMPSKFEPCGLSQIIAMRYGTLPIVRETGGLKDTVVPYNRFTGEGTGFSFAHFNGEEMGDTVFRAARLFWDDREEWDKLVKQAMQQDFSWKRSARTYMELYHGLHPEIDIDPESQPEPQPESEAPAEPKKRTASTTRKTPTTRKAPAKKTTSKRSAAGTKAATAASAAKKTASTKAEATAADKTETTAAKASATSSTKRVTATKRSATKKVATTAKASATAKKNGTTKTSSTKKAATVKKTSTASTASATPDKASPTKKETESATEEKKPTQVLKETQSSSASEKSAATKQATTTKKQAVPKTTSVRKAQTAKRKRS